MVTAKSGIPSPFRSAIATAPRIATQTAQIHVGFRLEGTIAVAQQNRNCRCIVQRGYQGKIALSGQIRCRNPIKNVRRKSVGYRRIEIAWVRRVVKEYTDVLTIGVLHR